MILSIILLVLGASVGLSVHSLNIIFWGSLLGLYMGLVVEYGGLGRTTYKEGIITKIVIHYRK